VETADETQVSRPACPIPGGWEKSKEQSTPTTHQPPFSPSPISTTTSSGTPRKKQIPSNLGGKQLARYEYQAGAKDSRLVQKQLLDLPVTEESKQHDRHGGHDLTRIPGEDGYFVSDMERLWRFDCKSESFTPLGERHEMANVKSISQLKKGGPILVLQANEKWYATGPRTIDETLIWELPKARIYKARWWLP
jgi:hypothetical protein